MRRSLHVSFAALSSATMIVAVAAQNPTILLRAGDTVAGAGAVIDFISADVNDTGSWIVYVNTDNADPGRRLAIVLDGAPHLVEGDALTTPVGATFDGVSSPGFSKPNSAVVLVNAGAGVDGIFSALPAADGLYLGQEVAVLEGTLAGFPGAAPGTTYEDFSWVSTAPGYALVRVALDDHASAPIDGYVLFELGPGGAVLSEERIVAVGDPQPWYTDPVNDIFEGIVNSAGETLYRVSVPGFPIDDPEAVYLDNVLLAHLGQPSPFGSTWGGEFRVDLNEAGDALVKGRFAVQKAGVVVYEAGGAVRSVARTQVLYQTPDGPWGIKRFEGEDLADSGDVALRVTWLNPDVTINESLLFNDTILLTKGRSFIEGRRLIEFEGFWMSDNARYIVVTCVLDGNIEAAVLLDTTLPQGFCNGADGALASCPCGNVGSPEAGCDLQQTTGGVQLAIVDQDTAVTRATLSGTGFPPSATPTSIVIRSGDLDAGGPVVFGDGLRCIATTGLVRLAATVATGGVSTHVFGHGVGPGTFYYQAWFRNQPIMFCDPMAAFNLSSGQVLTWQ